MSKRKYKAKVYLREVEPRQKGGTRLGFELRLDLSADNFLDAAKVIEEHVHELAKAMELAHALVVDEVYVDNGDQKQGCGQFQGKRVLWESEGDAYRVWELSDDEWALIDTQPSSQSAAARLAALHTEILSRNPLATLRLDQVDLSGVTEPQ